MSDFWEVGYSFLFSVVHCIMLVHYCGSAAWSRVVFLLPTEQRMTTTGAVGWWCDFMELILTQAISVPRSLQKVRHTALFAFCSRLPGEAILQWRAHSEALASELTCIAVNIIHRRTLHINYTPYIYLAVFLCALTE